MSPAEFLCVLGMTAVTYPGRAFFLGPGRGLPLPGLLERALSYLPTAVLAALIAPAILMPGGSLDFDPGKGYLPAAAAAVLAGLPRRDMLAAIAAGLLVFFLVRLL